MTKTQEAENAKATGDGGNVTPAASGDAFKDSEDAAALSCARENLAKLMSRAALSTMTAARGLPRRLMESLRKCPQLASEVFETRMLFGLHPLWFAIFRNLNIELVQEIYNMYPGAVLEHGKFAIQNCMGYLHPFHVGCSHGFIQAGPILDFLLQVNPSLLAQQDTAFKEVPLAIYARKQRHVRNSPGAFAPTVQKMLEHTPRNPQDNKLTFHSSEAIFRHLLEENVDDEILESIFGNPVLPPVKQFSILSDFDVHSERLSLKQAKAITLLLPHLQQLTLTVDMTGTAFEYLLQSLTSSRKGCTGLECSLMLPQWNSCEEVNLDQLMRQLIANKTRALGSLRLRRNCHTPEEDRDDDRWIKLVRGDHSSEPEGQGALEKLVLDGFYLLGCMGFLKFLQSPFAPRALEMKDLEIFDDLEWLDRWPSVESANLTSLRIEIQDTYADYELVRLPSFLSSLNEFDLQSNDLEADITRILCHLLQQTKLQKLAVGGFTLDVHSLSRVLPVTALESLKLDGCNFVGSWDSEYNICDTSRLKEFTLFANEESQEWWESLIRLLSASPTLCTVCLRQKHSPDTYVSEAVVDLLAQNRLRTLKLDGNLLVEIESVCAELATNTSLKELNIARSFESPDKLSCLVSVLENQNYTIETVAYWGLMNAEVTRLGYLADLNMHGRGKVTSPTTPRFEFVELLRAVNLSRSEVVRRDALMEWRHQLLYGLLRTAPGLWSNQEAMS